MSRAHQRYTVEDLDLARERFATPHVELGPWGNLVVTPASDPHGYAIKALQDQVEVALAAAGAAGRVYVNGPPWRVPGGSGYTNQPDLTVLAAGTTRRSSSRPSRRWSAPRPASPS